MGSCQAQEPAKMPAMESLCLATRWQKVAVTSESSQLALETSRLGRWGVQDLQNANPISGSSASQGLARLQKANVAQPVATRQSSSSKAGRCLFTVEQSKQNFIQLSNFYVSAHDVSSSVRD